MKKTETSPAIPQLLILPAVEWETIKQDINFLKEAFGKNNNQSLGDWLTESETQSLLHRKGTSLWRLRKDSIILSKKIGSRNYYNKQSIIDFLNSEK